MSQEDARVALISGGRSGLGAATVARLRARGDRVIALDLAPPGVPADDLLDLVVDVTDEPAIASAVAVGREWGGRLDLVVTCAGIAPTGRTVTSTGSFPADAFRRVLEVNVMGTYLVATASVRWMLQQPEGEGRRGVVVTVGSVAARDGQRGTAAYAASKGAVAAMTRVLAHEWAAAGVRCVCIAPGTFDTPMVDGLTPAGREELDRSFSFPRRPGRPQEFADLVVHVTENPYLNGTVVELDGAGRLPHA